MSSVAHDLGRIGIKPHVFGAHVNEVWPGGQAGMASLPLCGLRFQADDQEPHPCGAERCCHWRGCSPFCSDNIFVTGGDEKLTDKNSSVKCYASVWDSILMSCCCRTINLTNYVVITI